MRSKLQSQVLSVYRKCLRAAKGKPGFLDSVRAEFRENARAVPRHDVMHIEHLLRKAEKKIKLMQDQRVSGMQQFTSPRGNKS